MSYWRSLLHAMHQAHAAGSDMIVPEALSWYVGGATEAVPDNSKLILDTHVMFGHQGWKALLEQL
jgi:hypothetical protein